MVAERHQHREERYEELVHGRHASRRQACSGQSQAWPRLLPNKIPHLCRSANSGYKHLFHRGIDAARESLRWKRDHSTELFGELYASNESTKACVSNGRISSSFSPIPA